MARLKKPIRDEYETQEEFAKAMYLYNLDYDLIYGNDKIDYYEEDK